MSVLNYTNQKLIGHILLRPIFECGLYWRAAYNCEITVLCFKVKEQGKTTFKLKMCTLIYLSFFLGQITLVFYIPITSAFNFSAKALLASKVLGSILGVDFPPKADLAALADLGRDFI